MENIYERETSSYSFIDILALRTVYIIREKENSRIVILITSVNAHWVIREQYMHNRKYSIIRYSLILANQCCLHSKYSIFIIIHKTFTSNPSICALKAVAQSTPRLSIRGRTVVNGSDTAFPHTRRSVLFVSLERALFHIHCIPRNFRQQSSTTIPRFLLHSRLAYRGVLHAEPTQWLGGHSCLRYC